MSGLDKMTARIIEEAETSAAEVISEAGRAAEELLARARKEAEANAEAIVDRARREGAGQEKRKEAALDMQRKQAILRAKQEMIGEVLENAYRQVLQMDEAQYFGLMEKLLIKYVLPEEGEISFSEKDLKRMPADFPAVIERTAKAAGGALTLKKEAASIEGGFILAYGGVEENCTLRAVFDSKKEELSDMVNRTLFR